MKRLGRKNYSLYEVLKSWLNGAAFRLYFLKIWLGEVASRLNLKGVLHQKNLINLCSLNRPRYNISDK